MAEEKGFIELFFEHFPEALRSAFTQVIEAETPLEINRQKALYNRRVEEFAQLKEHLLASIPKVIDTAVENTVSSISRHSTPASSAASSRASSGAATASRASSGAAAASRANSGSTAVSAGEWGHGGYKRKTRRPKRK
jgi:hypothetical protein